jgi:hypothetical protein
MALARRFAVVSGSIKPQVMLQLRVAIVSQLSCIATCAALIPDSHRLEKVDATLIMRKSRLASHHELKTVQL